MTRAAPADVGPCPEGTDEHSQAPGFYRRRGYEVVGEVPDYPPGVTEYILTKRL